MKKSKLVRDNIPEIIHAKWEFANFYVAENDVEYFKKLNEKIIEELEEVLFASSNELIEELADLKEVVLAIAKFKSIVIEKLDILNTTDTEIKEVKVKLEKILDCIDYISRTEWISKDDIESARINKKAIKWWFEKRIILINN